jgi:hypothetical protein
MAVQFKNTLYKEYEESSSFNEAFALNFHDKVPLGVISSTHTK